MKSVSLTLLIQAFCLASFHAPGRPAGSLDGMTECFPAFDSNAQERVRHPRIIATPRPAPNYIVRLFEGMRRTIGTVRGHRVDGICNGKYSRPYWNVRTFLPR